MYYPLGYEHYLEQREKQGKHETIAAQVKAEDQALIAGMRAVPKAEHHQLREIPTETAYMDWKQRLAAEALDKAGKNVENIAGQMDKLWIRMIQSEAFWAETIQESPGQGQMPEAEKEELEKLKKIAEIEQTKKDIKKLESIISKITDFIKENKSDINLIKPIVSMTKELGYENPTKISNIKDAEKIVELIS